MFKRQLEQQIIEASTSFYAIALIGPRQSGKTTLLQNMFFDYEYVNLEDFETLARIKLDPKAFFSNKNKKWIIDEAQEYPELFSYLLVLIDQNRIFGQFILSGSQNFFLLKHISQSLAGRIGIFELLPLNFEELKSDGGYSDNSIWQIIHTGSYPGVYKNKANIRQWYSSYITSYLQRDVRQVLKIKDITKFYLFLKLCAARSGKLINYSELSNACGVSNTTINEWISLLEISYIIFRVQPYYKNFNKRIIKTPKLYFFDSGIICHLLGIESYEHAQIHADRGALFENYIMSEIYKYHVSKNKYPSLYFWNSQNGFEIDLLIENEGKLKAVEIKSASAFTNSFLRQLTKWQEISKEQPSSQIGRAHV